MKKDNYGNSTEEEIEIFYRTIGENVRKVRLEKNIAQLDLALEIGIKSIAFFSNAESGRYGKHFNIQHIYQIAKALEIDVCELLKK